jgi:2,5-diketo-D-gluconate reductase A
MGADPEALRSYCEAKGIAAMAYSPLGPTFNQSAKDVLIEGPLTTGVGKLHNKTGAQVALRWVAQRGVAVVTRATDPRYLAEDVDIFGWNLTAADLAALDAATEPAAKACLFCSK